MDQCVLAFRALQRTSLRVCAVGVLLVIGLLVPALPAFAAPEGQSRLGDYVWYDANANGEQDTGEAGIDGVVVNLYPGTDCAMFIRKERIHHSE